MSSGLTTLSIGGQTLGGAFSASKLEKGGSEGDIEFSDLVVAIIMSKLEQVMKGFLG